MAIQALIIFLLAGRAVAHKMFLAKVFFDGNPEYCSGVLVSLSTVLMGSMRTCSNKSLPFEVKAINSIEVEIDNQKKEVTYLDEESFPIFRSKLFPNLRLLVMSMSFEPRNSLEPLPLNIGQLPLDCEVHFYGHYSANKSRIVEKRIEKVNAIPYMKCSRMYGLVHYKSEICVITDEALVADSGSPLVCQGALTAIKHATSYYKNNGKRVDVYVLLREFSIWIRTLAFGHPDPVDISSEYEARESLGDSGWLDISL